MLLTRAESTPRCLLPPRHLAFIPGTPPRRSNQVLCKLVNVVDVSPHRARTPVRSVSITRSVTPVRFHEQVRQKTFRSSTPPRTWTPRRSEVPPRFLATPVLGAVTPLKVSTRPIQCQQPAVLPMKPSVSRPSTPPRAWTPREARTPLVNPGVSDNHSGIVRSLPSRSVARPIASQDYAMPLAASQCASMLSAPRAGVSNSLSASVLPDTVAQMQVAEGQEHVPAFGPQEPVDRHGASEMGPPLPHHPAECEFRATRKLAELVARLCEITGPQEELPCCVPELSGSPGDDGGLYKAASSASTCITSPTSCNQDGETLQEAEPDRFQLAKSLAESVLGNTRQDICQQHHSPSQSEFSSLPCTMPTLESVPASHRCSNKQMLQVEQEYRGQGPESLSMRYNSPTVNSVPSFIYSNNMHLLQAERDNHSPPPESPRLPRSGRTLDSAAILKSPPNMQLLQVERDTRGQLPHWAVMNYDGLNSEFTKAALDLRAWALGGQLNAQSGIELSAESRPHNGSFRGTSAEDALAVLRRRVDSLVMDSKSLRFSDSGSLPDDPQIRNDD